VAQLAEALCYKPEGLPAQVPGEVFEFLGLPNPCSRSMGLGSTQPLTEMSTRNLPGRKKLPARRADNFAAISEPNVCKLWEPQPLATLRATTASTAIGLPLPSVKQHGTYSYHCSFKDYVCGHCELAPSSCELCAFGISPTSLHTSLTL
jgi:hypothetical protein